MDAMNINLGNTYDVEAISSFDASVQLKAPSGHTIWLSHSMCANIYAVSA